MFTLEESALLGRMLRFLALAVVCVALGTAAYVVFRFVEQPRAIAAHPSAPPQSHPHHS